jgi:hypothetical protein
MYTSPLPQHRLLIPLRFVLTAVVALCFMTPPRVHAQTGGVTVSFTCKENFLADHLRHLR